MVKMMIRVVFPLNCFYILMAVSAVLHQRASARFVPYYMLVVLLVNMVVWTYWDSQGWKETTRWVRLQRSTSWILLLLFVPILALIAVEERTALVRSERLLMPRYSVGDHSGDGSSARQVKGRTGQPETGSLLRYWRWDFRHLGHGWGRQRGLIR